MSTAFSTSRAAGLLALAGLVLSSSAAAAQEAVAAVPAKGIDETINAWAEWATSGFVGFIFSPFPGTTFPWIVMWLITAATIFSFYFMFVQIRCFWLAVSLVKGDYANPKDAGEVSHFQALSTALSGTVGLGNIAGVTVAVAVGGPGATFWMILAGFVGMASKFTECTLGVKYRNEYADGTVSGGPMYYLSKGLAERGKQPNAHIPMAGVIVLLLALAGLGGGWLAGLIVVFAGVLLALYWKDGLAGTGRGMAAIFAVFCILGAFGGGNMFQANQVHAQLVNVTGGDASFLHGRGWLTGLVMASVVFAVIVGGIKSIARFAERIVPLMALIYCGAALAIILMNIGDVPWAIGQIIQGAFTEMGVAGGAIGALIQGFRRATFSNEAGIGSASIAHSAVRTNEPVTEGFVSLLEPFIDTVVICTMTALVIVITGVLQTDPQTGLYVWDAKAGQIATPDGLKGVALTSYAFATAFSWFPYVLAIAVILFAFSTMVSWSYYGVKAWTYLFGEGKTNETVFNTLFCLFVVIGSAMNLGAVIDFADASIFAMALINIAGLYILMPVVKREMESFLARLRTGEIRKTRA